MVLVHDCDVVVEYLLRAFRHGQRSILVHVFRALATVLFENAGRTTKVMHSGRTHTHKLLFKQATKYRYQCKYFFEIFLKYFLYG